MSAAAKRIALIDGLRGYFLVLMISSHLHFQGGAWLLRLHHGEVGFVEDAQGFVFLSGLVVGLTYARILAKRGAEALTAKATARVGELYRMLLLTLGVVMAIFFLVPDGDGPQIWGWQLGKLAETPLDHLGSAAALLYQPAYLDILPQYMIYLILAPIIVRRTVAGYGLQVMAISAAVWLIAQMGLHVPLVEAMDRGLAAIGQEGTLRSYFNPMGWQLLFVGGVTIGAATVSGKLKTDEILSPARRDVAYLALALVALFAVVRVAHGLGWLDGQLGERFYRHLRREDLSLVYVANFAALGYGVAWLLRNAEEPGIAKIPAAMGRALRRFFSIPFLVFLGQHSLQVYAFHVVVAYSVVALDWYAGPFDQATKSLIIIAAVASMLIPANWHAMTQRREAAKLGRTA